MSEKSYESLRPGGFNKFKLPKFSPLELDRFGLNVPSTQLSQALRPLLENGEFPAHPSGVLLFGYPGCGEDHIQDVILQKAPRVKIITLQWRKLPENMEKYPPAPAIKVIFNNAKKCGKSIILIEELEKMVEIAPITSSIITEMTALRKEKSQVVVLGHSSAPWKIPDELLLLFQTKIYIPFPAAGVKTELLRFFLRDIVSSKFKGFKKITPYALTQEDCDRIEELPVMNRVSWRELEQCARTSLEIAICSQLGLRSDDISKVTLTDEDLAKLSSSALIKKEHVQSAVSQIVGKKFSSTDEDKFIADWKIKTTMTVITPQTEAKINNRKMDNDIKKIQFIEQESFLDCIILCFFGCAETCC